VDALAVRLTVPPAGSVGDFHLQVNTPCRAHQLKVIDAVVEKGLTVRETERLVAEISQALAAGRLPVDPRHEARPRLVRRVVRDIRIFFNAFQQAVEALKEAGFAAEMTREDMGDWLEIRVRIPKERSRP